MKHIAVTVMVAIVIMGHTQPSNLKHYYYWINQAELAICDSAYEKASDCYARAFEFKAPFLRHASNAFVINCEYVQNTGRAVDCFRYLAIAGEKPEWYVKDTLKYMDVWTMLCIVYDTTRSTVNLDLQESLYEIISSDQAIRKQWFEDEKDRQKAIKETDSLNLQKILLLYQQYPIISDYTAGMNPILVAPFVHFAREFSFDPYDILFNEVMKGNIDAQAYVLLEDECRCDLLNQKRGIKQTTLYGTNTTCFFVVDSVGFIVAPPDLQKVNQAREEILLSETWEDFAKKCRCRYIDETDFVFFPLKYVYYLPEDAFRVVKETKEKIDNGAIKGEYYVLPKELR